MSSDKKEKDTTDLQRRSLLKTTAAATIGLGALNAASGAGAHAEEIIQPRAPIPEIAQQSRTTVRESVKITKLETILVKPRWLFLKVHTNVGVVGLGEPITEGRALTCAAAVKEIEPYLIGKDPRAAVHHWQAIYRHAFYRGGPILTSALSGIDQALWDIKGKLLGVPVYELLGGPTRQRIRVYAHAGTPELIKERKAQGFTAFKTGPARLSGRYARAIENKAWIDNAVEQFGRLREIVGKDGDIGIDFHGAVPPATA
ncbi:MAG TPA: galactonate dehydratase, partial [Blastocatellia bacterium]|nr:galactonate dehydratase [Blastocatellia bacterium]